MARVAFATRAQDEAGNAVGGSAYQARVWDDFACTVATVLSDNAAGTVIAQPLTPNAGTYTTLGVTTGAGDTIITVASTTGFAVGQLITVYDSTNTIYRWIRSLTATTITLESAVGFVFSSTSTQVGNLDQIGVLGAYVPDSSYHYLQITEVASGRKMPPTLIPTMIGTSSVAVLEEGAGGGTRPTINFISPFITATDNAPSTRVDITGPTAGVAPTTSAVGDAAAEGVAATIVRSDHRHGREAFAALAAFAYAAANGVAATLPRSDHNHGLALTTATALLGADVSIAVANTYYDGPSVSLGAGTWLVDTWMTINIGAQSNATAKLWDGTTVWASGGQGKSAAGSANHGSTITASAIITLGGTTTVKVSGTCTAAATIKAAVTDNGAGNNATGIAAVRIA